MEGRGRGERDGGEKRERGEERKGDRKGEERRAARKGGGREKGSGIARKVARFKT